MKARMIVLTLALFTLGLAAGFAAENPNMGTWNLNEAKSKFAPDAHRVLEIRVLRRRLEGRLHALMVRSSQRI